MQFIKNNKLKKLIELIYELKFNFETVLISLFCSIMIVHVYIYRLNKIPLNNFKNGVISISTMMGVDVNLRISFFYKILLFFFISFIVINLISAYILYLLEKNYNMINFVEERKFISFFSLLGIFGVVFEFLGSNLLYTLLIIKILLILTLATMIVRIISCLKNFEMLKILCSNFTTIKYLYILAFSITVSFSYFEFEIFRIKITDTVFLCNYLFSFVVIFILVYVLIIYLNKKHLVREVPGNILLESSLPVFLFPIAYSICNELFFILNQHGIFVMHPVRILTFIFLIMLVLALLVFRRKISIKGINNQLRRIELRTDILTKVYYPLLVIIVGFIISQPDSVCGPPIEFFESGNAGIGIQQLFQYGKIPILETFGAHFLSEQFWGILYSLINGYNGAAFLLYNSYDNIIILIILYYFLSNIMSKDYSLMLVLFFPIVLDIIPSYYAYSLLAFFAVKLLLKRSDKFIYNLLFWMILSFVFMWRADLGFAAIVSAVIIYIIYKMIYREKIYIKNFLFSLIITCVSLLSIFIFLALIKNINPIIRIKEILNFLKSNQNWGYPTVGNELDLKYYIYYAIFPIINILFIIYLLYKSITDKVKNSKNVTMAILFVSFFQIFNFQRALVRHSLVEHQDMIINAFIFLILSCIPYIFNIKGDSFKKVISFCFIGFLTIYLIMFGSNSSQISVNSNFENCINKYIMFNNYKVTNKKIDRYVESDEYIKDIYGDFNKILNYTLKKDETFIDFSNEPYLYVLTNRETPMYVNQTPAYLSDIISQKDFLNEISNYSIPYVVYSTNKKDFKNTDGVSDCIRSYMISEYINKNYTPFVEVNGLDIWVKKTELEHMQNKLDNMKNIGIKYQNINIVDSIKSQDINMGLIPYYWGQYGYKDDLTNSKIVTLSNEEDISKNTSESYAINCEISNREDYIYINLKSKSESNINIQYGCYDGNKEIIKGSFKFKAIGDNVYNKYLIRASCQYNWMNSKVNYLTITSDNDISIKAIEIKKAIKEK